MDCLDRRQPKRSQARRSFSNKSCPLDVRYLFAYTFWVMHSLFALLEKLPHDYEIPYDKNVRAHSFHCKRCNIERNLTTLRNRVQWFAREIEELIGIRVSEIPSALTKPTPEQAQRVEQWLDA